MTEAWSGAAAVEVKRLLDERGWSIRELARQTGIHPATLTTKLNGPSALDLDDVQKVCTVLGVAVTDLLPGVKRT